MAPSEMPQSVELQKKLTELHVERWLAEGVFQIRWWILIGLLIAMCIAWLLLLDKAKAKETCLFLVLAVIVVMGIDEYGEELVLWDYPVDLIPIFPPLTSANLISVPLAYSIAFQRFSDWKRYAIAAVLLTAVISFVLEPVLVWGGLYELVNWHYAYSFIVYLAAAFAVRFMANTILQIEHKARGPAKTGNGRA